MMLEIAGGILIAFLVIFIFAFIVENFEALSGFFKFLGSCLLLLFFLYFMWQIK